ncbi:unnamed protein product [Gulo gulo]|nr:unnamed protein product [Gulo gulo]
MTSLRLN